MQSETIELILHLRKLFFAFEGVYLLSNLSQIMKHLKLTILLAILVFAPTPSLLLFEHSGYKITIFS